MYKLHIQNETVRRNVAFIIETIRQRPPSKRQTLHLGLDLKTGLLHLPGKHKSIEIHLGKDIWITEKQKKRFNLEEMNTKARQVLSETCHYLKSALAHLNDIEFEPSIEEITGRDLLHEAWHAVERQDAELILLNTKPGTYLFRKDRFAGVMEEILSAAKKSRIRCFTLTYLDPESQVRDKTIVAWKDHWLFYDDDPTLTGTYFQSLEELLSSLGATLKRPLPALKHKQPGVHASRVE